MTLGGLVFCDRQDGSTDFLTARRTAAAVPFASRYRAIDFPLSALAHAEATEVSLIAGYGFHSLAEHVGGGRAWGLSRERGGFRIVSPYRYGRGGLFRTRLEALFYMTETLESMTCDLLVMADTDTLINPDLLAAVAVHKENRAALTWLAERAEGVREGEVRFFADAQGRVTAWTRGRAPYGGYRSLGVLIIDRALLLASLADCRARGQSDLMQDLLLPLLGRVRSWVYPYHGPAFSVGSAAEYYQSAMRLLCEPADRRALLADGERPILTPSRDSTPTVYGSGGGAVSSLIGQGCRIDGQIENSVLFDGVTVGRGSIVRNSVLFGGSYVGRGCALTAVMAEKHTVIRDGVRLSGHAELPLLIDQGRMY